MNLLQALSAALTPAGLAWTAAFLGISTFLHELVHYAAARRQGVKVLSFSVGMGPVLLRRRWNGTEWRLSALPIGGYVQIDGMNPQDTHGYASLRPWRQILILLLAPLSNLLLAFALLTGLYRAEGLNTPINSQILIAQVLPQSRAEALGLRAGDRITALDGRPIPERVGNLEGWQTLGPLLQRSGHHSLGVSRGEGHFTVSFDWQAPQKLGVKYGPALKHTPLGLGDAAAQAARDMLGAASRTLGALRQLLERLLSFNFQPDNGLVGPVGTAQAVSQAARLGPSALIAMLMAINLGLGLMNLLPIPGLDGGHALLVLLGWLRGRPLSAQSYQALTLGGLCALLSLGLFTFARDVVRVLSTFPLH